MTNRICTHFACVAFALSVQQPIVRGEVKGDVSLLDAVAKANRENWDKVHTWTGEVELKDVRTERNGARYDWSSIASYVYRQKPYALKWHVAIMPADLERTPGIYMETNGVINDGKLYSVSITKPKNGNASHRSVAVYKVWRIGQFSGDFDPMQFTRSGSESVAERFAFFSKHSKSLPPPDWTVEKGGDVVSIAMSGEGATDTYLVNLKEGGNLEAYDATGSEGIYEKWTFVFQKRDDVWLPKTVAVENQEKRQFSARRVRWVDSRINIPAKDSDFTLSAIGMTEEEQKQVVAKP
jgi:hypothetical protein